jgi:hypothetical protein
VPKSEIRKPTTSLYSPMAVGVLRASSPIASPEPRRWANKPKAQKKARDKRVASESTVPVSDAVPDVEEPPNPASICGDEQWAKFVEGHSDLIARGRETARRCDELAQTVFSAQDEIATLTARIRALEKEACAAREVHSHTRTRILGLEQHSRRRTVTQAEFEGLREVVDRNAVEIVRVRALLSIEIVSNIEQHPVETRQR